MWMPPFRSTFTLGHLAGVPVRVTAGAVLVAGALMCVVGSIAVQVGLGVAAYGLAAAVAVAVPASFLAHELGHALIARRLSVRVSEVRLLAFGARTRLEEHARTPRAHVAIAAAGPVTSIALGIGIVAVGWVLLRQGHDGLVADTLVFLGAGNIVLGTFNLLPGLPLDGGAILVGWLWARRSDRTLAVQRGLEVGHVLGSALVLAGGTWAVAQQSPAAVWPVAVGTQLFLGARAGRAAAAAAEDYRPEENELVLVDAVPGSAASVDFIDLVALEARAEASEQAA